MTKQTFLPLDQTKERAVTLKKAKCVYSQSLGTTEHITMLCGALASGVALPPMIIYPQTFPGGQYQFGGPDDSVYARSDSGTMESPMGSITAARQCIHWTPSLERSLVELAREEASYCYF